MFERTSARRSFPDICTQLRCKQYCLIYEAQENMDADEKLIWSRSGATAGRGFHFQDAIGSLLASMIANNDLPFARIVPEGFEDLHLEGDEILFVQVKSRQEQRGPFSVNAAVNFLLEMWEKQKARTRLGTPSGKMLLVLERLVETDEFSSITSTLKDLANAHPLIQEVERRLDPSEIMDLLQQTSIITVDWMNAHQRAVDAIASRSGAPRSVAELIEREFRTQIASAADANANAVGPSNAFNFDRLSMQRTIERISRIANRDSLERAIRHRACSIVNFDAPVSQDEYFLGTSALPSHISAGIAAPRPSLTGYVIEELSRDKPVLLSGPSGVGKSTVLWSAVFTRRDIVWYQVHRLDLESLQAILDLIAASSPSPRAQVGLVVDGVGTGDLTNWDSLQRSVSQIPGVLLLGSVRQEDLLGLASTSDCSIIPVALDEEVAESIYENLRERKLTSLSHWRESLLRSNGLTMEFTYLLTQGRRLPEVIDEQVQRRVREGRELELRVLALASTAHRWGATASLNQIEREVPKGGDLRRALARLTDEHLLRVVDDTVVGLHPLRSQFLSIAVHRFPPPSIAQTIGDLVSSVEAESLPALMGGIARDYDEQVTPALAALTRRLSKGAAEDIIEGFTAVRRIELHRRSVLWLSILEEHSIPLPARLLTLQLSLLQPNDDAQIFPPRITAAISALRKVTSTPYRLLTTLIDEIGPSQLAEVAIASPRLEMTGRVISSVRDAAPHLISSFVAAFVRKAALDDRFQRTVTNSPLPTLSEFILTATVVHQDIAVASVDALGGTEVVLERIRANFPLLVALTVEKREESFVAAGTLLHVSDEILDDVEKTVKEIAKLAISCLPQCDGADIRAVWQDGKKMQIGHHEMGVSTLKRRYVHPHSSVGLNQQVAEVAATRFHTGSATERLARGFPALKMANELLERSIHAWLRGENRLKEIDTIRRLQHEVAEATEYLLPPVFASATASRDSPAAANDYLHTLLVGISRDLPNRLAEQPPQYSTLALFVTDTLAKAALRSLEEPWHLVDSDPKPILVSINEKLNLLSPVLLELGTAETKPAEFRREARSGAASTSLERAAVLAARAARRRHRDRWEATRHQISTYGHDTKLFTKPLDDVSLGWPPIQVAIGVQVSSVIDWLRTHDAIIGELQRKAAAMGFRPALTIFPMIENRRIDTYAVSIISTALPELALSKKWPDGLPEPWRVPTAVAIAAAHAALVILSGLAKLRTFRETEIFAPEIERCRTAVATAYAVIADGPPDVITQDILDHIRRVQRLVDNEWSVATSGTELGDTFAGQMIAIMRGEIGELARTALIMGHIAVQADIDRTVAIETLFED